MGYIRILIYSMINYHIFTTWMAHVCCIQSSRYIILDQTTTITRYNVFHIWHIRLKVSMPLDYQRDWVVIGLLYQYIWSDRFFNIKDMRWTCWPNLLPFPTLCCNGFLWYGLISEINNVCLTSIENSNTKVDHWFKTRQVHEGVLGCNST